MMNEERDVEFGVRVRNIRKSLNLTQKDFSEKLNMSIQTLSDIERSKTYPCYDFFYNLLKKHRVSLNYLLLGEGNMFLPLDKSSSEKKHFGLKEFIYRGDNEDVRDFLEHFFRSKIVYYNILGIYQKLKNEEELNISKELDRLKGTNFK
jgi:transcriptional regulator with XRE-family HTH domain